MILLGNALAGLQDYASSVEQFQKALALDPQNPTVLVSLGSTEAAQRNFAEAERSFLKAREVNPRSIPALVSLANFYAATGKKSDAEKVYRDALSLYPADRDVYVAVVAFYFRENRFEDVEKLLKEAQAKSPEDPAPALMLVGFYRSRNREGDAKAFLLEMKKKFPENKDVALELASMVLIDDPAAAKTEIDGVLKSDPQNIQAQVLFGELQFRAKQYDQAVATLSVPSILSSKQPRARLLLGLIDVTKGQTDRALEHLKNSLDQDPTYAPSRLALAELLLRLGRNADAGVELKKVLDVQPGSVEARLLKTALDTAERRFGDAERELTALAKEQPANPTVHLRLGTYYVVRGMAPNAEKSLLHALELKPDSEEILRNVVEFFILQRAPDRALKVIHDTVPDSEKRAFHYWLTGRTHSKAGRSQDAEAAFKKAIQLESDQADARGDLIGEYIVLGRHDDALKEIDDLLKLMPTNANAYQTKGMIFEAKGNLDLAKENYDRSLKLNPDAFIAANNLAFLLAEEGRDLEVALKWAQNARRLQPNEPASADTLGWVQYKMGQFVSAREQLQFAVSKRPESPGFQYHLAKIYKETKQPREAQTAVRKALASKTDFKERSQAEALLTELNSAK
jgi:tetratricopeptide (TPR) repeat protein